jgi:hypothetical protein
LFAEPLGRLYAMLTRLAKAGQVGGPESARPSGAALSAHVGGHADGGGRRAEGRREGGDGGPDSRITNASRSLSRLLANDAEAIIGAAGLALRKPTTHRKAPFTAKQGATTGIVNLAAKAAATRASYDWEWSVGGGKRWTSLPLDAEGEDDAERRHARDDPALPLSRRDEAGGQRLEPNGHLAREVETTIWTSVKRSSSFVKTTALHVERSW